MQDAKCRIILTRIVKLILSVDESKAIIRLF